MLRSVAALLLVFTPCQADDVQNRPGNLDRFNYRETVSSGEGYLDYGPRDWGRVRCANLEECVSSCSKANGADANSLSSKDGLISFTRESSGSLRTTIACGVRKERKCVVAVTTSLLSTSNVIALL